MINLLEKVRRLEAEYCTKTGFALEPGEMNNSEELRDYFQWLQSWKRRLRVHQKA